MKLNLNLFYRKYKTKFSNQITLVLLSVLRMDTNQENGSCYALMIHEPSWSFWFNEPVYGSWVHDIQEASECGFFKCPLQAPLMLQHNSLWYQCVCQHKWNKHPKPPGSLVTHFRRMGLKHEPDKVLNEFRSNPVLYCTVLCYYCIINDSLPIFPKADSGG